MKNSSSPNVMYMTSFSPWIQTQLPESHSQTISSLLKVLLKVLNLNTRQSLQCLRHVDSYLVY